MPKFCRIFAGFSQLGPGEMYRVPAGYREVTREGPRSLHFPAPIAPYRTSKKVSARSSARPLSNEPLSATSSPSSSPAPPRGRGATRWPSTARRGRCGDVRERRLAKFRQNVARFRLYRLRFLQENMRFAAFFKIYQILKLKFLKFDKILQILRHLQFFC